MDILITDIITIMTMIIILIQMILIIIIIKRKRGYKTYNKEMEKGENYFSESDEKEDPKEISYVSKDNEKKGSITESKIEEKVISDNKAKNRKTKKN